MIIRDKTGKEIVDAPITKQAVRSWQLMTNNYIQLSFELCNYIDIPKGSYIEYQGEKFYMIKNFYPEDLTSKLGYKFEPVFDSPEYWLQTRNIYYSDSTFKEVVFTDTTNIAGFAEIVTKCANEKLSKYTWSFAVQSDVDTEAAKTLAFSGDTLFDACTMIAEIYETEWWAVVNSDNITIYFGKLQVGNGFEIKVNETISSMPSRRGDDTSYGTRFYVYGSTRNLTSDYGQVSQGGVTNHISELRLRLPSGINYIDAWEDLQDEEVIEKLVFFDDVYPKNTDTVTEVSTVERSVDDSDETFDAYIVHASASPFTTDDIIDGETIKLIFTSGVLNGYEFEVAENSNFSDKEFELIATHTDDGNDGIITVPGGALIPAVDDTFILTGVALPDERITEAENELLEVANSYVAKNSQDTDIYDCETNPVYCIENEIDLPMGQNVILTHQRFGSDGRQSRLQGFEKALWNPAVATYQFGDNTAYSKFGEIESEIDGSSYNDRLGVSSGNSIYIITQYDRTAPSDFNVNSAKRSDYQYLNRQTGGIVKEDLGVNKNLQVGGVANSDVFQNATFTAGALGSGYQIKQHTNGQSYMEVDNILVRRNMTVNELSIAEIKSVGGTILLSLADLSAVAVTEFEDYYRIYFNNDNGSIPNNFSVDDQAICRKWNGDNIKYYWRLVVAVGDDYIDVSKTDCDGTSAPEADDAVIQLGNRTDVNRQSAIMLSAYGSDAPSYKQYRGINSYDLTGKECTVISPDGNKFTGNFIIESSGEDLVSSIDASLEVLESEINTKVSDDEFTSEISQLSGEINSKVSNEQFDSEISQLSDQITLEVASGINKLEIGGRNYITKSEGPYTLTDYSEVKSFEFTVPLVAGEEYVISWSGNDASISALDSMVGFGGGASSSKQRIYNRMSFTAVENATHLVFFNKDNVNQSEISKLMAQEGSAATQWALAPEDVEDSVASSLSITDNKITLKSNTIELDGTTVAKAIEAQDLKVGDRDGASALEVNADGTFYAKGSNGDQSLVIDSQNQSIELHSNIVDGGSLGPAYGDTKIEISSANGGIRVQGETSVLSSSVAKISSGGIYANTALQGVYPLSSGIEARASIVGIGNGKVNELWYDEGAQFVAGVYGKATNVGSGKGYGGYFENLRANGMVFGMKILSDSYTGDSFTLLQNVSMLISVSTRQQKVTLRSVSPQGTTVMLKQVIGNGYIRIIPLESSKTLIYDDTTSHSYIDVSVGQTVIATCLGSLTINGSSKTVWVISKF